MSLLIPQETTLSFLIGYWYNYNTKALAYYAACKHYQNRDYVLQSHDSTIQKQRQIWIIGRILMLVESYDTNLIKFLRDMIIT